MTAKKASKRVAKKAPVKNTVIKNEEPLQNGFGEAIGFPGTGFGGLPFGNEQVSSTDTLFKSLRYYLITNFRQLLSQLFAEVGLIETVVCVPVDDALRGGFMLKSKQLDEGQIKELQMTMDTEKDLERAGWAAKWTGLYGGGGIMLIVMDQDPEEPLDLASIDKNTELVFRDVDMWELFSDRINTDDYAYDIDDPFHDDDTYFNYYGEQVHQSRVRRLIGPRAPSFLRPRLRGWGLSRVERLVRSINQYMKATDLGFEVLDEFKVDVYKVKNLISSLMGAAGTENIKKRIQMTNWQKNYQHAIVLDSEEDFDNKQISFTGLAEAMTGIRMQVAADMRMPITKLFGTSVSGGFSTDQNDMENYNSMVESEVRSKLKPDLLFMARVRCQQLFGFIPDDLDGEWKPLRELTALDQETVKTQKFTRVSQAKQAGEITTLEYRDACNKGQLFDIQLDTAEDEINSDDPELEAILSGEREEQGDEEKPGEKKKENAVKNRYRIQGGK